MLVVKVGDGLGNQLFNYATGYAAAKKTGEKLKLDISECDNSDFRDFQLNNFNIDCKDTESFSNKTVFHKIYKRLRRDIKYHVIFENVHEICLYDERVYAKKKLRDNYLHGYWQNFQFFEFCKEDIKRQFTPNYPQTDRVKELIAQFKDSDTCAVHIRGGDIVGPAAEYFKEAIEVMKNKNPHMKYIIFTNDVKRANESLKVWGDGIDYEFISSMGEFSDIDEFFLISACRNQIISNSTFSWWAAYLNDYAEKTVIAPYRPEVSSNIYPKEWTVI